MDKIAVSIKNRLSLRPPQTDSLNILAELIEKLDLKKHPPDPSQEGTKEAGTSQEKNDLKEQLEIVNNAYPTCTDFERSFPSICFALATGVGKTRLMGAFAAYLYLSKGIRNFFVLAPNLTIYNKLIEDFSNTTHPKYVFKGIGEFVHNNPVIITGDNYNSVGDLYKEQEIRINVFNISKINSEMRGGKLPRIKRLSEYLGDSYFNYLSNLDDLVLLMDESHHYRADRGMEVINELNPVLGLELTATPKVERSGGPIKFKNVVYEYSLSRAIQDGFVKEPAVATRRDFDPAQYSLDDLDRIKLEDGIRIHEDTKVALDIFSRDNKMDLVKPFVLVVAKDTDHARKLKELIVSNAFFEGRYADKVTEIHSNQTGEEKDENIAQLLSLESHDNRIEIVIHVNMLKEGWDVTNLYTIIPLRTAASTTLREQTIGRGLRLPYGKRTGNDKADKLTIVAHDKFQEIIDEANKPDSIIRKENIITIDAEELCQPKEVVTAVSTIDKSIEDRQIQINSISDPEEKHKAQISLDVRKAVFSALPDLGVKVTSINDLKKEEIRELVVDKIKQKIESSLQQAMFSAEIVKEAKEAYEILIDEFKKNIIEIPRATIQQSDNIVSGFLDFDLDVRSLNYQPGAEQIIIVGLGAGKIEIIDASGVKVRYESVENMIVNELINFSEIDYDAYSDLLFKLGRQALEKFMTYLTEDQTINVVQSHKKEIGSYIFSQMMEHFYCEAPSFEKPVVRPFTRIEEHNLSKYTKDDIRHFTVTITPTSAIPGKVFSGFRKACHNLYKFDSKTEKDFTIILENDKAVLKWLKPSSRQFNIYWDRKSKQYTPDFVAETPYAIYMIETKKEGDIETTDVREKAQAALQYCRYASEFTAASGGKSWRYVLIPHNAVLANMSFDTLVRKHEQRS